MNNYETDGSVLKWTNNTGNTVVSGQPIVLGGGRLGVAAVTIPDGESGSVETEGEFRLPKKTGASEAIAHDTAPIFDVSAGVFIKAGSAQENGDLSGIFLCMADAGDDDTTVRVKINVPAGTVHSA